MRWIVPTSTLLCLSMAMAVRVAVASGPAQVESTPSVPARADEMRHHFLQITRIHEAVIRGDLGAVLAPAAELATIEPPTALPAAVEPFVAAIRQAGRAAATAPNLRTAAFATVAMLRQCAECHLSMGVLPAPSRARRPDVGGIVGHMLEHQQAADALVGGLVVPSDSSWREGADRLGGARLHPGDWPRDPKLTLEVREAETSVHALAGRAQAATTANARAAVYVDLLTTCASCHSLHRRVWGPRGAS